ncbi:uncharacterized protein SCHCODRAFT_01101598 [Schizophyllum commune H4-8]|uniref:Expressed protein n=1 Tax=Schizophyllum commune (strain H4-8 / FGSC 9210) TaxID=578458 RepID=D8QCV7_SCHCM|nr:uncharacterized protein SCHCODRAFT_01101598 [Schizophyllum commune H4-8]KAI5889745.1 hypothetical protein SCHCODRAFT_01101598 [Schizophyllum commune H4-8]
MYDADFPSYPAPVDERFLCGASRTHPDAWDRCIAASGVVGLTSPKARPYVCGPT